MRSAVVLLVLVVLGFATAGRVLAATVTVDIFDTVFFPPVVTINVGDTVQWVNVSAIETNSVTNDAGIWDSGLILPTGSFSLTFPIRGIFTYHSGLYFPYMNGIVIVNQPGTPALTLGTLPANGSGTSGFGAFAVPPGIVVNPLFGVIAGVPGGTGTFFPANAGNAIAVGPAGVPGATGSPVTAGTSSGSTASTTSTAAADPPANTSIASSTTGIIIAQSGTASTVVIAQSVGTTASNTVAIPPAASAAVAGNPVATSSSQPESLAAPNSVIAQAAGAPGVPVIVNVLNVQTILGMPFNFSLSANGSAPIQFVAEPLPLGLYLSGDSIVGIPETAGTFVINLGASNSEGSVSAPMTLFVADPATGDDTDDDGFSDDLELTLGSNPLDPNSTPFGIPPGVYLPLSVDSLGIKLNFASTGRDSMSVAGSMPVPAEAAGGNQPDGQAVIDFGGVIDIFQLNSRGAAQNGSNGFALKLTTKNGGTSAKFSANLRGSFAQTMARRGLGGTSSVQGADRNVRLTILYKGRRYEAIQTVLYSAKQGVSAIAKKKIVKPVPLSKPRD